MEISKIPWDTEFKRFTGSPNLFIPNEYTEEMRLLITGGTGMLGSALSRIALQAGLDVIIPTRNVLDLRDNFQVREFLIKNRPDTVIHSAALVGGISANIAHPVEFLSENVRMDNNLLQSCNEIGVQRLIYFGSSCMYPTNLTNPMTVDQLYSGKLEPTNEGYALSKLVGAKHVQYVAQTKKVDWKVYISSNLYGPGDHFEFERSHLIAAIIRKVVEAKINGSTNIDVWGDGLARREFTFVEDLAEFTIASLDKLENVPIMMNVGSGIDYSVSEYYGMVMDALNVRGELNLDSSKPVGMSQKLLNVSVARSHGWKPKTSISSGLATTINWYLKTNKIIFPDE